METANVIRGDQTSSSLKIFFTCCVLVFMGISVFVFIGISVLVFIGISVLVFIGISLLTEFIKVIKEIPVLF